MRLGVTLLAILLAGCGGGGGSQDTTDWFYLGGMGLYQKLDPILLDDLHFEVSGCMGLWSDRRPVQRVFPDATYPLGRGQIKATARHEFIHQLLEGATGDRDSAHAGTHFERCAA